MSNLVVDFHSRKLGVSEDEMQVLKDSLFKGFTEPEISFSMAVANKIGLSPLLRQIHFVKRKDHKTGRETVVSQTGIDGFRLIAERTGKYAGSDEATFEIVNGKITKATVTVYKIVGDQRVPFTASVWWEEYAPSGTQAFMWNKMPRTMLGKCAEAQALRKAFPAEMSGLYADEEMHQADHAVEKAKRIQDIIMKEEKVLPPEPVELPPVEDVKIEVPVPFDEYEPGKTETVVVSLGDFVIPGCAKKYAGKKLSEVNKDEFCKYIVDIQDWFKKENKKMSPAWKDLIANAESYFG